MYLQDVYNIAYYVGTNGLIHTVTDEVRTSWWDNISSNLILIHFFYLIMTLSNIRFDILLMSQAYPSLV